MKLRLASFAALALAATSLAPVSAHAGTDAYEIDAVHSAVIFRVQHFNAGFTYGRFNGFKGTFAWDAEKPEACNVEITVDAASVDTNDKKRDDHLRTPDFLDVAKFPTITFKSTAVKKVGDTQFDVTGTLTLHGVTKSLTVRMDKTGEAKDAWGAYRMGFEGTIQVKRSEYGIVALPGGVGDDIRLTIAIEGTKKA